MKHLIAICLIFSILMACGSSGGGGNNNPPVINNTVSISCASVDNDQTCTGVWNGSTWESGPVQTSGDPMPIDWLNIEVMNNMLVNATVFVVGDMAITGCYDLMEPIIPFDAVELLPGETVTFSTLLWNYRCGMLGDQDGYVTLYSAVGFDPSGMNPEDYPLTDMLSNELVEWDNRVVGNMP